MMKKVLFVKNITLEGPGLLGMFLKERNIPFEIVDLYAGNALPGCADYGAVVILGGPMNVYEESRFSFLRKEKEFINECLRNNIPLLGICLGAQLLACCLEANVIKNELPEIGTMSVNLTEAGKKDRLFSEIDSPLQIFQWHGDTFEIPKASIHLAESDLCRNQAFTFNNIAYGVQFHIEVTLEEAKNWARTYLPDLSGDERKSAVDLLEMPDRCWPEVMEKVSNQFCDNFFLKIAGYI